MEDLASREGRSLLRRAMRGKPEGGRGRSHGGTGASAWKYGRGGGDGAVWCGGGGGGGVSGDAAVALKGARPAGTGEQA